MTDSSGERRCPDDLVVRGQREHLTEIERQALFAHLAQCAECRAAAALTALFDAVPDAQPGDDDLIARVADKSIPTPRRFASWPGLRVAATVALAVLACGAATAAWMAVAHRPSSTERGAREALSPAPSTRAPLSASTERSGPTSDPLQAPASAADETPPAVAPQRKHHASVPAAPTSNPVVLAAPATAASLFAEANAVRRSGEIRAAIGLYQSLRRRFPESSQALLSAVSVGDLLLGEGEAAGAVTAYGAYLRGSPDGALTEEALFGRARGLRMLGRDVEERQTWEQLLRRFPRSAYQPAACRRLRELAP
jgi:TolA-binding protein